MHSILLTFPRFIYLPPTPNYSLHFSGLNLVFFLCNVTEINISFFQKNINAGQAQRQSSVTGGINNFWGGGGVGTKTFFLQIQEWRPKKTASSQNLRKKVLSHEYWVDG